MSWKIAERMTAERFRDLCSRMTRKQIADDLGITVWTVCHYERRFGVKPLRAFKMPTRERFAELAERHTKAEIARLIGVSYAAVCTWEKAFGISCKPAARGRQTGQVLYETQPYRACWLVQGGLWNDMRQCAGG